jgi:hypothetical protein
VQGARQPRNELSGSIKVHCWLGAQLATTGEELSSVEEIS